MRILIIEDNILLAESLRRGLKSNFAVDIANTGRAGIRQAEAVNYDLLMLDLTLPDINGEAICRRLRDRGLLMPILVISGRDTVQSKVSLLDMGVDDYITKPFNIDEVKARIRLALRHTMENKHHALLSFGDLTLDPAARIVKRCEQLIGLRRKEFDLLEYFMRNPGKTLTRPMILEHIWDSKENLWANVIDVHIKHLRDRVDKPFTYPVIKTVHGVGYKLEIESTTSSYNSQIYNDQASST